jgi:parvulin-like peptidyl-prolyl isomerase
MNKKWVVLVVVAVFFAQCRRKPADAKDQAAGETAAALEQKVILTIGDVSRVNRDLKNFIRLQYADIFEKQDNDKLLSRLFDVFCEQQVILFKAQQEGVTVTDEEVTAFLAEARSRGQAPDLDGEMVRNTLQVQKFLLAAAYREIDVPDAEIAAYYEGHLDDYRKDEEIELHQIMVDDREKLLRIRSELLNQPGRFAEVARDESIAPEAGKGGLMGFFEKGTLPQEMEEVVFSLKENEISPIVESPYGLHLFKVTRRRRSRMQPLASVQDQIKNKLLSARMTAAYEEFLQALKAEVPLRVHYENLYFSYKNPDPGANDNENKNFPGSDPLADG